MTNYKVSMKNSDKNTITEWCAHYDRAHSDYSRFTEKIKLLLSDILQANGIGYHLIEARTKSTASFREKIARSSKSYTNPLRELTDLTGLRIITYYQDVEAGFIFDDLSDPDDSNQDATSDLVLLAGHARINTLSQFENILVKSLPWVESYFADQFFFDENTGDHEWHVSAPFICELVLIRTHVSHLRPCYLLQLGWDRSIASRVFKVAKDFRPREA
jgi:hypothetical protein